MKKYKVAYYIGDEIGIRTKVESGFVLYNDNELKLKSKIGICVADLMDTSQISLFMLHGLGSVLKIQVNNLTIFLSVVRFCIAGQFVLVNRSGTRKLRELLESYNTKDTS